MNSRISRWMSIRQAFLENERWFSSFDAGDRESGPMSRPQDFFIDRGGLKTRSSHNADAGESGNPMWFPLLCAATVLLSSWSVPPVGVAAETPDCASLHGGPWEILGTSGDDARYPILLRVVERSRSAACRRLASELELRPTTARPIAWQLEIEPSSEVAANVPGFLSAGRTEVDPAEVRVLLPARRYLTRPQAAARVVTHEACHAVLASSLGRDRYLALPPWFREGLALWFADEGLCRVDERISSTVFSGATADSFLVGVSLATGGPRVSYAESYLAFSRLREQLGADGLRSLLSGLGRSWTLERAVRELTGESPPLWIAAALRGARQEVRARLPMDVEEQFRHSLALRRKGSVEEAVRLWEGLQARDPTGALRDTLDYLEAGQRLERVRRLAAPDAAVMGRLRDDLRAAVLGGTHLWQPELLLLLGDTLRLLGEDDAAVEAYREVVEAYPQDVRSHRRARARLGGR